MSTEIKNAHRESCVSFFFHGLIEDYSPGDSLSDSSEEMLQRGREEARICVILAREYVSSSIHFDRRLLLVMRNRYHS